MKPLPVAVALVAFSSALAGCLATDEDAEGLSRFDFELDSLGPTTLVMGVVWTQEGGYEVPVRWYGTLETVWTAQGNPGTPITKTLSVDETSYEAGPFGFVLQLEKHDLPLVGCFDVMAKIFDKGAGLSDTASICLASDGSVVAATYDEGEGYTAPTYGLVSDSAGSSTAQWTIKLSSANRLVPLTQLRFVLTTPSLGPVGCAPMDDEFMDGDTYFADKGAGQGSTACDTNAGVRGEATKEWRLRFTDIDGNGKWSIGDVVVFDFDGDADGAYDEPFPPGEFWLEIFHVPTGTSAGALPRTF